MTLLAITGHRGLPAETSALVDGALRDELDRHNEIIGLSCLADGADALFARAVLDAGGTLVAVIPAEQYRDGLPADYLPEYDDLLSRAAGTIHTGHTESTKQSHMDASLAMIDRADTIVAVWDQQPARGYGGTADVVEAARNRDVPVTVIWPEGATRD